jgi:peroxiredoxin
VVLMGGKTIATQVAEMRADAPAEPDPRMATFAREAAALAHVPVPDAVQELEGTLLPDAELLGPDGSPRSLGESVGDGLAVLVFYRGAWCPFCNIALRTYQEDLLPELRRRGVGLVAVSPQKPDGSLTMKEKHGLEYAVLSDPGLTLARAAGVLTEPGAESLQAQRELGLDLTEVNADGTASLPMPTVAIVDQGLAIRWIDTHADYTTRTEVAEILAALDGLG